MVPRQVCLLRLLALSYPLTAPSKCSRMARVKLFYMRDRLFVPRTKIHTPARKYGVSRSSTDDITCHVLLALALLCQSLRWSQAVCKISATVMAFVVLTNVHRFTAIDTFPVQLTWKLRPSARRCKYATGMHDLTFWARETSCRAYCTRNSHL